MNKININWLNSTVKTDNQEKTEKSKDEFHNPEYIIWATSILIFLNPINKQTQLKIKVHTFSKIWYFIKVQKNKISGKKS